METQKILGTPVAVTDYEGAFECLSKRAREPAKPYLVHDQPECPILRSANASVFHGDQG